MAGYDSKYTGQQVEELLGQVANGSVGGGGSSDKVEIKVIYPVVYEDVWTYQIPAGKFVELAPVDGITVPSYVHFELLDPVEKTMESEDDLTGELSKYHFVLIGLSVNSPFGFGTNTNRNATPDFIHNITSTTDVPFSVEFDVLCSLIHYPASTGYPDSLYGYITMAPLYT